MAAHSHFSRSVMGIWQHTATSADLSWAYGSTQPLQQISHGQMAAHSHFSRSVLGVWQHTATSADLSWAYGRTRPLQQICHGQMAAHSHFSRSVKGIWQRTATSAHSGSVSGHALQKSNWDHESVSGHALQERACPVCGLGPKEVGRQAKTSALSCSMLRVNDGALMLLR